MSSPTPNCSKPKGMEDVRFQKHMNQYLSEHTKKCVTGAPFQGNPKRSYVTIRGRRLEMVVTDSVRLDPLSDRENPTHVWVLNICKVRCLQQAYQGQGTFTWCLETMLAQMRKFGHWKYVRVESILTTRFNAFLSRRSDAVVEEWNENIVWLETMRTTPVRLKLFSPDEVSSLSGGRSQSSSLMLLERQACRPLVQIVPLSPTRSASSSPPPSLTFLARHFSSPTPSPSPPSSPNPAKDGGGGEEEEEGGGEDDVGWVLLPVAEEEREEKKE